MYKKLLFDLDNTLVDDDKSREYAFSQILLYRKEIPTKERVENFLNFDNQFWTDRAIGKIKDPYDFKTKEEKTIWIRAQRFINYFKDISFEEATMINNLYVKNLGENIFPIKNVREILEYLYKKEYEIFIITNGPKNIVDKKIKKIFIQKYIKEVFTAEDAGHMKPHKEFFRKFLEKENFDTTDDLLIIGDELDKDILGGINNGIDTCWFNINKKENYTLIKPNYEIKELMELRKIL